MHARTDQLLSIRDGEPVDAHIAQHIEQCPSCSAQLQGLSQVRDQLRALPQLQPPADSWQQIQFQLSRPAESPRRRRRIEAVSAAAAIAIIAVLATIVIRDEQAAKPVAQSDAPAADAPSLALPRGPGEGMQAAEPAEATRTAQPGQGIRAAAQEEGMQGADSMHVADLVAQSQQLEHLLQALPQRPRIERVSTAATVDTIERRIQWLDFQLSYAPEDGLDEAQARQLWRERVELMDSLVKVRYAEAGHLSF